MFVGHTALALAAKHQARTVSLGWLVAAAHSLLMATLFNLVAGIVVRRRGTSAAVAGLIVALVLSHWILDWLTHVPDLSVPTTAEAARA